MFIPIGTDRPRTRPTLITYWLIGICFAVFLGQTLMERNTGPNESPAYMNLIFYGLGSPDGHWWQLLTYQFLHADLMHLLGNMLFLWVFGPPVEDRLRRVGFLGFYLVGGVAAGLAHNVFSDAPVLGASGSISAVTGAFLVLFPLTRVRVLLLLIIIGVFSFPAWWFIAFAIAKDLFFSSLGRGGVAYAAHLGGYAFGAAVPMVLLWRRVLAREPYDLFSIGRQAHRRRQFRELTTKQGQGGVWTSDTDRVAKPQKVSKREAAVDADVQQRRSAILRTLNDGKPGEAARMYLDLLELRPDESLPRDQQMLIGNQLFEEGRHDDAARAYELLLSRNRNDREANHVRLLLALINARYLNDPLRATELLKALDDARLSEQEAALASTLREELG